MVGYRRHRIPGGTYFFTLVLADRHQNYLTRYHTVLGDAFRSVRAERPFDIDGIVLLPEHLHVLMTLPPEDADYSVRWRMIKSRFTQQIARPEGLQQKNSGSYRVWQPRYWEHCIRDTQDFNHHLNYIHINPAKHGYVKTASQWPYSSIHRYVQKGLLPIDWASDFDESGEYGE